MNLIECILFWIEFNNIRDGWYPFSDRVKQDLTSFPAKLLTLHS